MLVNNQLISPIDQNSIKIQNKNNNFQNINTRIFKNNYLHSINANIKSDSFPNYSKINYKTNNENKLNDTLSQISEILNKTNKNLNYSGLINKIPIINEEENFVYEEIILNKKNISKAKFLSNKIKKIKMSISDISSKESFSNCEKNLNKNKENDSIAISCCFFKKN